MRKLAELDATTAKRLRGVLFDLDDTVLTHGRLTLPAYQAMTRASDRGLVLVAVTGRPRAWGEVHARQWPVAFVVVENGALAVTRDGAGIRVMDPCDAEERAHRVRALEELTQRMARDVPELAPADDAWCRRTDTTWDIGERTRVPAEVVARAAEVIRDAGAVAFASSVHLHASFDRTDKAQGAVRYLYELLGEDASRARTSFAFVGDSGNDAPCFSAFHASFGVANVARSLARLPIPPRFVAPSEMGAGFAEVLDQILALRENGANRP